MTATAFTCKRCGKCCLTIPCIFAQFKYLITSRDNKVCPSLIKTKDGYECQLIKDDPKIRETLLSGDCDDPALAGEKKTWDAKPIVREFFPNASDAEVEFILWNKTSYPGFWNIPEDGWTPSQCLRSQLKKLKKSQKGGAPCSDSSKNQR